MTLPSVHLIAAARPNFMKVAPLYHQLLAEGWCRPVVVHTGQHYDQAMSGSVLSDLGITQPDFNLGVGSGTHAEQTAGVMVAYERLCAEHRPDYIVVVGDVNSTLACALVGKKLCLSVAHLEAGLRSGDRSMPEEINRMATDAIADLHWTPSPDADENLRHEGVAPHRIVRVGNIMIDSFEMLRQRIAETNAADRFGVSPQEYGVATLHRPVNVDDAAQLRQILDAIGHAASHVPVVFPIHPRTRQRIQEFGLGGLLSSYSGIRVTEPLSYLDFMSLVTNAMFVVTDSGGIQEETTYLDIPCLTLRETTERPITTSQGSNRLVEVTGLPKALDEVFSGHWPHSTVPEFWDGKTASRVAASLRTAMSV